MQTSADLALPVLRDDLQLRPGPTAPDGAPTWTIYDPTRARYFRLGWLAFEMLSRWSAQSVDALLALIKNETTCRISEQDILDFIRFLFANNLTVQPVNGDYQAYVSQYQASRPNWYMQILHHYLFFRIPFWRPDRFLRQTLPYLQGLFDIKMAYLLVVLGLVGFYLVSRQWDTYTATFLHFFNWQGVFFYGLAIGFSKLFHELGHAYTAVRFGCRVPIIGLAFMVLFPMPYTDVTDAWRLPSRKQRVAIGSAGMMAELGLAVFATLAWSFLPDGPLRSAAFILSSSTWLITLTINLSPLMRFDGYYILADAWGIDNLQPRSFALARWYLRRFVLGGDIAKPESFPASTEAKMVTYAYATWLYRLVVFTGLALLVYHFAFKLLGLLLFAVEVIWFIALPIVSELGEWRKLVSKRFFASRAPWVLILMLLLLAIFIIPWNDTVRLPAILEAEQHTTLYAPQPALIEAVQVKPGQDVKAGQVLFKLKSPKLEDELNLSKKRLDFYRLRLERAATSREASADMHVAMQQWSAEAAKLSGLKEELNRLLIRAPFAGKAMDVASNLHTKRWLDTALPLATIVAPVNAVVQGIADEEAVAVLMVGQSGRFIPDDILAAPVPLEVMEIDRVNIHELDKAYFASVYEGAIAVRTDAAGKLVPTASMFAVRLKPELALAPKQIQRGLAVINAKPRSFARRIFDGAAVVLVRGSGF